MATLRQHMLMFLPIVSAIGDRIEALERARALPQRLRALLDAMAAWLASGTTDPAEAARLQMRGAGARPPASEAIRPGPTWCSPASWRGSPISSTCARTSACCSGTSRDGTPVTEDAAFRYTAAARTIRHRDHGMALLSAVGVFLSILLTSAIWIATGWPEGRAPR